MISMEEIKKMFELVAFCTSGLEGAVAYELRKYGYKIVYSSSGRIFFNANLEDIPFLNMYLKSPDRILILVREFKAETFDDLFEHVKNSDLKNLVEKNARIVIDKLKITNSKLSATGAVASVLKKAIVENLGGTDESGPQYDFTLILKNDEAYLLLDTTGESLSKRGYRIKTSKAPLRETIAASLIILSHWSEWNEEDAILFDPFCGSGTIPIEAAIYGMPNIKKNYSSEHWKVLKELWRKEKEKIIENARNEGRKANVLVHGSDIDCDIVKVAKENFNRARKLFNTKVKIDFSCSDFRKLPTFDKKTWVISNLPYGERLKDRDILKDILILREKFPNANFYLLHPDNDFEKKFGKATKKVRFQNSGIWTYLYMYYDASYKKTQEGASYDTY